MQIPRISRLFKREETWSEHERRAETFVVQRMHAMARLSPEDVDAIADEALSHVDREQTMRELAEFRATVEKRRGRGA